MTRMDTRLDMQHQMQQLERMAFNHAVPYRNATSLCNHLMSLIFMCDKPCKEAALLMREWRETEQMKREWRGLPRLSPTTMKELLAAKRDAMKEATSTLEVCTEVEEPTVTAPPTP